MDDPTASSLDLPADGGNLRIERDQGLTGWSRFFLVANRDQSHFLGAEALGVIAGRLIARLSTPHPSDGRIEGHSAWWVLSLAEGHHSLYTYFNGPERVLVWQDKERRFLDTVLRLSQAQYEQWRSKLMPLAKSPGP